MVRWIGRWAANYSNSRCTHNLRPKRPLGINFPPQFRNFRPQLGHQAWPIHIRANFRFYQHRCHDAAQ
jgi:hypothetical protein